MLRALDSKGSRRFHFFLCASFTYVPAFMTEETAPVTTKMHVPHFCVLSTSLWAFFFAQFFTRGVTTNYTIVHRPAIEACPAEPLLVLWVLLAVVHIVQW